MEMRAREDINIGEDLTPPLSPLASTLYNTTLSSHCSACFSTLSLSHFTPTFSHNHNHVPQKHTHTTPPPPPPFFYCSPLCSSLDSPLHFSSGESLLHQSESSTCHDSSDLRLSLRLLSLLKKNDDVGVLERIGGLMTNRERLLHCNNEDDDVSEVIRDGAKAMVAARRCRMEGDGFGGGGEDEEVLCTAVLCLVMTNAVEVLDESGRGIGVAVYDATFSWINHSCSPNACYRFTKLQEDGGGSRLRICPATAVDGGGEGREGYGPRMIVRSIKAIKKGEEVTITYTDLLQPKALRQSELWSKYRFDCCCERCSAIPATYVDQTLQEMIVIGLDKPSSISDQNLHNQETIKSLIDHYDDAINEYLSFNNPDSCCQELENLLTHGQINEQPEPKEIKSRQRIMLHPFHQLSLNAYTILSSAYKVRVNELLDLDSETEKHNAEAFELMKLSAAYLLILAGATHHLFGSEASLIVSVANFWVNAGESLLNLGRSDLWDLHFKRSPSSSNYKCYKCSLLDEFNTASIHRQEQHLQIDDTIRQCLGCIVEITSKLWTFLIQGECYLRVIKDPIDFRWLTTIKPCMMFDLGTHSVDIDMKNYVSRNKASGISNDERTDLLQLGIHSLLYGAFLSRICFGEHSHLICNVRNILKSEGILIT